MLKNMFQKSFSHSCFKMASSIRLPMSILLLIMEWLEGRMDTSLKLLELYYLKWMCQRIFGSILFPLLIFFINRMPMVLNWNTLYYIIFPNKPLFPIKLGIFGCACFVRDVRP